MLRINFLGMPFSGKTYWAVRVTNYLRDKDYIIDYIEEPFKDWAYEKRRPPDLAVQIEGFGIQLRRELSRLESNVGIVTDSGLWTVCYYLRRHTKRIDSFIDISREMDNKYKTINFLLQPMVSIQHTEGELSGRWDLGDFPQRKEGWNQFRAMLRNAQVKFIEVPIADRDRIIMNEIAKI